MISSNTVKIFLFFLLLSAVISACGFWRNSGTDQPSDPVPAGELKSDIPFETKEPDIFQADIVITNYVNGAGSERVIKTARHGAKLRCDYPGHISFLQLNENERFSMETEQKTYAPRQNGGGPAGDALKDFLTTEWLNEKRDAKFEALGAENGLAKYRIQLAESKNSEILIYVDENLKIPVRQEFYQTDGDQKTLVYTMELKNIKLAADEKQFEIPADYRELSPEEFQKIIRLPK